MSVYDLIIVGGGISGLRVGIETLKKYPNLRCCILEKYGYIGGRIVTFRTNIPKVGNIQWENGAGRISTSHKKVLKLLKDYKLTFIPIPPDTYFLQDSNTEPHVERNTFSDLISVYIDPLEKLSQNTLKRHTLKELLDKTLGSEIAKQFYIQFPYYSEIHTLRADLAIKSFKNEMASNEKFGICAEGLSSLTDAMKMEFLSRGGKIFMDTELLQIKNNSDKSITLNCKIYNSPRKLSFKGKIVVLALHHTALTYIDGIKQCSILKRLTMMPLLRIYAVFPSKKGVSWFSGLSKIVTNSPIRYIIPIDQTRGIVMISYTDGLDAKYWIKEDENGVEHGNENVKELLMNEIRHLFPDRTIPDPIFFKQHPWYDGCTYWLPGNYDVYEESMKSLHPLPVTIPNLYMCGESFAVNQCWIESALDQADNLINNNSYGVSLRNI
jgi:hypothetical protein